MDEGEVAVILFPEAEELKKEAERLKIELSMLFEERDELRYVICKNLEAAYMLKVGGLEYQAYKAQCQALRLKRKAELIQARRNRQERVVEKEIEETLDREFAEYQQRLKEQSEKLNEALRRSRMEALSEEETREIKKLYREVVKRLHPDLNPGAAEEERRLFENAVEAYQSGDLTALRAIRDAIGEGENYEKTDAVAELIRTVERREASLKRIREEIEKIKSEFPYTAKELLEDEKKIAETRQWLEQTKEAYRKQAEYWREKIKEMLREENGGYC